MITDKQIEDFQRDGVVMIPGAMTEWIQLMIDGVAKNLANPSEFANENDVKKGRFFDDYVNWHKIPEFEKIVRESPASELAGRAMRSKTAQFFHDHVLVKDAGTPTLTPWHQDMPYYFVEGTQTVSLWMPLDPVTETSLRFIAGSHKWEHPVRPVNWNDNSDFYKTDQKWTEVPDPDSEDCDLGDTKVLEWKMNPGDIVLFDFKTVHGARGNLGKTGRRALSLRWTGDDVRYIDRPGKTSPPFPGHGMANGDRLREDWFPVIWRENL